MLLIGRMSLHHSPFFTEKKSEFIEQKSEKTGIIKVKRIQIRQNGRYRV